MTSGLYRSGLRRKAITKNLILRATILFINFFLIILAYYHIKPASRSLFIEYLGADFLPYVWIITAVFLGLVISYYHRLIERCSRLRLVLGSLLFFLLSLIAFYRLLDFEGKATAVAFYVFVDIFGVMLVEQFWSLTNSIYRETEGKRWYGIVGTGGLVGGVVGGKMAKFWLQETSLGTSELLLVAAAILAVLMLLNLIFGRIGIYGEIDRKSVEATSSFHDGWENLAKSRYLMLIAITLLLSQIASPLVEYKFMSIVEANFTELNVRTGFLSGFFADLGMIAIGVNLIIAPIVYRHFGTIAGLTLQPFLLLMSTWHFYLNPGLFSAKIMKISDRALAYSINRASRELLYIPIGTVAIYQAKAWIDMFGYRMFKVIGSVLILLLTQWLPVSVSLVGLSWLTMGICIIWLGAIFLLAREHRMVIQTSPA